MVPVIPKQRQHKQTAKKRFNDLINYLQGEQEKSQQAQQQGLFQEGEQQPNEPGAVVTEGRAGLPNEFSELLDYATAPVDTKIQGEKCIAIRTHGVSSIDTASAEMNAVSRKNTRCLDPVYHFILSWPEHEKPAPEAIFNAAEHAIKSLGFEEHQYVIAVHANTDNIHCHVAMNRVHPTTFKSRHIEWAKRTLHFAARESEIKHGWTHDNGIYVVEVDGHGKKSIVLNKKHAEADQEQSQHVHPEMEREDTLPAWHDPESLDSWLKTSLAKALKKDLPHLESWQSLHVWLDEFGITLKDTGGGGLRLRAISPETGEVLETPLSKGLRLLKRPALEERWGPFMAPVTMPLVVPDLSDLSPQQIDKGVDYVINLAPDQGAPPPDHVLGIGPRPGQSESELYDEGLDHDKRDFRGPGGPHTDHIPGSAASQELAAGDVPENGRGVHGMPNGNLAGSGGKPSMLLQGALQADVGNSQAGQNHDLRRPVDSSRQGSREGRGRIGSEEFVNGRRVRDPALRAQRKAERAAARADLQKRYRQYRNFVADGDTEYWARLKELREERSRQNKVLRGDAKAAKAAIPKGLDREVRLVSIIAIDAEVTRRKLIVEAQYQERCEALRVARVPPLQWREWLYEQSNRGDKAALSALRGIVYQAQRDAKLPTKADEELEVLELSAADYQEQQHQRLMARLLAEERKERAIRSSSVHMMRPHEVDALILAYAGIRWRVTGNGNIEYSRNDGQHLFTDRGNRVTFDRMRVTDEEIKLALVHSREKFGPQITLTGDDPVFVERMARLADDMGLKVLNPEMQPVIQGHRDARKQAVGQVAKQTAEQSKKASALVASAQAQKELGKATEDALQASDIEDKDLTMADAARDSLDALHPTEPIQPAAGEERLRAIVLAIDPRATFELADPSDEARLYVGPVASAMEEAQPMFAQHIGRSRYVIHHQAAPAVHDAQVIEVRYRGGSGAVNSAQQDKGQGR